MDAKFKNIEILSIFGRRRTHTKYRQVDFEVSYELLLHMRSWFIKIPWEVSVSGKIPDFEMCLRNQN